MLRDSMNVLESSDFAFSKIFCPSVVNRGVKPDRCRGPLDRLQGCWSAAFLSFWILSFRPAELLRFPKYMLLYRSIQSNFLKQRWQTVSPEVLTFLPNRD